MTIDANVFIDKLLAHGYSHLCVVPCSFAKDVINAAINNQHIEYIPAASEAVACSIAAGLKMSGKKPIVIVQSSGLTNMGSCITSLLKPYGVIFPILVSWRTYSGGSSEVQHQHLATELPLLVKAYGYKYIVLDNEDIDKAIDQINSSNKDQIICLINKDSFSKVELENKNKLDISSYFPRSDFLRLLNDKYKDSDVLFIGTTGNMSREMYSFMPDTNNFYMAGNMGGALSLGLGAAMVGKKVVVCGGDAEFVMHMGGITTAGRYNDKINLTYILFDNEQNKSTGGQNTYQQHVDYINIVKSSDWNVEERVVTDLKTFSNIMDNQYNGLSFIHVKCGLDEVTPRPPLEVVKVREFK